MGEIANDIIDGACCSDCGVYFSEEHGYPVLCIECWIDVPKAKIKKVNGVVITKEGLQKATYPEL